MSLTYATLVDFRSSHPEFSTTPDEAVTAALHQAEDDIDGLFIGNRVDVDTGRRWRILELAPYRAKFLSDAVIEQAVWRLTKGPAYFQQDGSTIRGPDFTIESGRRGGFLLLGPSVMPRLALGSFLPTWARGSA